MTDSLAIQVIKEGTESANILLASVSPPLISITPVGDEEEKKEAGAPAQDLE